ncbi:MAG: hypothetical protein HC927_05905 [Deltaproteobacteria bacterium]|nr:hypothetical protein [Deltaproteobacteria bacterium]
METISKQFAHARGVFYANPIFRTHQPDLEDKESAAEWVELRKFFAAAFNGEFQYLDGLLDFFHNARDLATRDAACKLLGDACTDRQLQAVEAFVLDAGFEINKACELCESLAIWGRLSAAKTILTAYDRYAPGQVAEVSPPTYHHARAQVGSRRRLPAT